MSIQAHDETPLFVDEDGEPLRFFLPMSLASRSSFKDKIERNGGVLVQSEILPSIIKIGDPAKPSSYDSSWLSFRYIDDAIREGALQSPEFYIMENVPSSTVPGRHFTMPTTQRVTPASGGLPNGVGTRGTRTEFTPEEDDILRRIVHRPGVATSGNKIYQLIADQYGGHSFHSWRDRYIRHMRPIWGVPTEATAMDVNYIDAEILTQSYLRAPHVLSAERRPGRASSNSPDTYSMDGTDDSLAVRKQLQSELRTPATPPILKKQRAAFSTTDDGILLRAIKEGSETAATYKRLGARHPHHTWESWKNRVKALKKKNNGTLPDPDQTLSHDFTDLSNANLDLSLTNNPPHAQDIDVSNLESIRQENADSNIDPQLQHHMLMIDDHHQEQVFAPFLDLPQQLPHSSNATLDLRTTEDLLRENFQDNIGDMHKATQPLGKESLGTLIPTSKSKGRRQINIHDPTADENAGPVSDIEDGPTPGSSPNKKSRSEPQKNRKTRAAALAAAGRAAALAKSAQSPSTPSKLTDGPTGSNPKSAKLEHHERERPILLDQPQNDDSVDFPIDARQNNTRSNNVQITSSVVMPESTVANDDRQWVPMNGDAKSIETFYRNEHEIHGTAAVSPHEQLLIDALSAPARHELTTRQDGLSHLNQSDFEQPSSVRPSDLQTVPSRSSRKRAYQEIRATPESSPVLANLSVPFEDDDFAYESPSPTPNSPNKLFSQSQFLQDTQAINGDLEEYNNYDTTMPDLEQDSQEQEQEIEQRMLMQQRKNGWIERQMRVHGISSRDAIDAWDRTSGVQSIAAKVVSAYERGESPPRIPGVWTEEDDKIARSTDVHAMAELERFHGGIDNRLSFLDKLKDSGP